MFFMVFMIHFGTKALFLLFFMIHGFNFVGRDFSAGTYQRSGCQHVSVAQNPGCAYFGSNEVGFCILLCICSIPLSILFFC